MPQINFRGIQVGRLHILVGLAPRKRKYRFPNERMLRPDDRFLGYDGYAGGEPQVRDGGVE